MGDIRADLFLGHDPDRFPNTRPRAPVFGHEGRGSSSRALPPPEPLQPNDPDYCRICRGEGTADEPLFYPCKCSGSIKYVHQDCLMEWLSHSQKKHCELCKTPFRFTKLYAPNMPKALPTHVFLSHVAKYILRNLLVWLRAAMVASVWLGWLPYLMRSVWSFLFWISDEGLGSGSSFFGKNASGNGLHPLSAMSYGLTVCPSSPLFAATTSVATIGGVVNHLPPNSVQLVNGMYSINSTTEYPLYSTLLRLMFGPGDRPTAAVYSTNTSALGDSVASSSAHPSLLSEVGFLRNLTRHPSINRGVIAVLEGQIITILVIVSFILIILVRDYVVQQQPEINMRAAFAPAENAAPQPPREDPGVQAEETGHVPGPVDDGMDGDDEEEAAGRAGGRAADRSVETDGAGPSDTHRQASNSSFDELRNPHVQDTATVHVFVEIFKEAGGSPDEILRIARERGLEQRLDPYLNPRSSSSFFGRNRDIEGGSSTSYREDSVSERSNVARPGTPDARRSIESRSSGQSSEWTWPDDQHLASTSDYKGKGKLITDSAAREEAEDSLLMAGNPLRPRANTDGPTINGTINPLANNSWSFADLPPEPSTASTSPSFGEPLFKVDLFPQPPPSNSDFNYSAPGPSSTEGQPRAESPASQAQDEWQTQKDNELLEDIRRAEILQRELEQEPEQLRLAGLFPANAQQAELAAPQQQQQLPHQDNSETPPAPRDSRGFTDVVADFMWQDLQAIDPAELAAGARDDFDDDDDLEEELRAVDVMADFDRRDAADAAEAAGLDPEAIEDAEDLEGILELLGMRGPVAGLFQNAIFCAFLVSITIFVGIFIPYNVGRITVWIVANPMRPARMLFSLSKFVQDCALVIMGLASYLLSYTIQVLGTSFKITPLADYMSATVAGSWNMSIVAANRIGDSFMSELPIISASEMRNFSALSHEALIAVKEHVGVGLTSLGQILKFVSSGDYSTKGADVMSTFATVSSLLWNGLHHLPEILANPNSWVISLSMPEATGTINPELAFWDGTDRFWAIVGGYMAMSLMAGLYLRRGSPFSSGQTGQDWEASIIDGLNQASGVMKVILIIGIEMLVFPLYCGMLLDIALLPLFESTTMKSRLLFTVNYPVTSIFIHWFVGTGYMFHFALFVSMCRKIMRKGVLYFIRDPDDPEFHPVKDVLERNVTTQLRKILFSAFVYGALVLVCLGGVVWGLSLALPNVLPIHYSSNEPVLEFPIDLLFYNFLMPLAAKFFKPSDGLHAMYTWWFRKCARALRITWFLFGERRIDEEGHLALKRDSPYHRKPWWQKVFLELDSTGEVVPKTWRDTFEGGKAKPTAVIQVEKMISLASKKTVLLRTGQLIPDGRFVRTPASDQVKIPKGERVFLEVTENNTRMDGKIDRPETDMYSTSEYQLVYVPPNFRFRMFLFIMFIWIFAAVTGVSITIIPLVFGRRMFKLFVPEHILTNDIYAFSIGVYVLGSAAYALLHLRSIYRTASQWVTAAAKSAINRGRVRRVFHVTLRISKIAYAYFFILLVFPLLVASLMELYALVPLHEFMYSMLLKGGDVRGSATADQIINVNPRHTIRVVQAWTIGLLYLKLGSRAITGWFGGTRLAAAVRAVLRRGWLDPDLGVLTRAFVIPSLIFWVVAVAAPLLFAKFTIAKGLTEAVIHASGAVVADGVPSQQLYDAYLVLIYRLSFPFMALGVAVFIGLWNMVGVLHSWNVRIRDEAYLIGERLHNFGVVNSQPKRGGAWRASGTRI
ncbi:hypothetical protein B0T19DRAFT_413614 [Cercophora scortea]|uniref:RING-type E3 ubiquitin transferase n=1 Tax=Cercophora scortea TaxID=314031 RepID=A0AAE0IUP6_9PEZI|nr:hypothetical protein B0T19DRAFT_413614 [Cercophora scortea]